MKVDEKIETIGQLKDDIVTFVANNPTELREVLNAISTGFHLAWTEAEDRYRQLHSAFIAALGLIKPQDRGKKLVNHLNKVLAEKLADSQFASPLEKQLLAEITEQLKNDLEKETWKK